MRPNRYSRHVATALLGVVLSAGAYTGDTNSPSLAGVKSRVVLVRDPGAVSSFDADAAKVRPMVAAGIKVLAGETDVVAAWRHFVSSNDVVGIKINTQSGPLQSTRRAVIESIAEGLHAAGVAATNVYVFDRDPMKMR